MPNFDTKPEGMSYIEWIRSKGISFRIVNPVRREFGSKAPSQMIESKVGGLPSYVISEGALEQEEIDHIGLVEDERELKRQKQEKSETKKAIGNLAKVAGKTKRGNRLSTMKKVKSEGM